LTLRLLLFGGCAAGAAGLAFCALVLVCGGLMLSEEHTNQDPGEMGAALARMTDLEVPAGLAASSTTTNTRTGHVSVDFGNPLGMNYLIFSTGPGQELRHEDTLMDSRERGTIVVVGRPEEPASPLRTRLTVRGRPAEFLIRRYAKFETVSGYFQGKRHLVFLQARFGYGQFAVGTAHQVVQSIGREGAP
jgi:hypothetical protein